MDKVIITVTCDCTMAYPSNPHNPTPHGIEAVADEYVRAIDAGASICHLHGPYTIDAEIQPDGTRLSDLDIPGWRRMRDGITGRRDAIIQYGIANGRFAQRKALMADQRPDMISTCFNAHDECFDYEPGRIPVELYGLHNREELAEYCTVTRDLGVKIEVEAFHMGGVWNAQRLVDQGMLDAPVWTTYFFGWRGGCWTPPTPKAVHYMADHTPAGFIWNTSVMDPEHGWTVIGAALAAGGHVRVGMEDNPFVTPGDYARTNAELVEKAARMARDLGREVASPEEARSVLGMTKRPPH